MRFVLHTDCGPGWSISEPESAVRMIANAYIPSSERWRHKVNRRESSRHNLWRSYEVTPLLPNFRLPQIPFASSQHPQSICSKKDIVPPTESDPRLKPKQRRTSYQQQWPEQTLSPRSSSSSSLSSVGASPKARRAGFRAVLKAFQSRH